MKNKNNLADFPDIKGRYIVLDTETTGIDIHIDYLISISAIEIIEGKITGHQFNGYVRSRDKKSNAKINNKNMHYFIEDYSDEIFQIERHTLENFLRFVNDSIIFAHNANFDYKFLAHNLQKWNLPVIPYEKFRCSLAMARNIIQKDNMKSKKYTVEYLCMYFGFNCNSHDFHHAYFDAFMSARVICRLFELASEQKEKEEMDKLIMLKDDNKNVPRLVIENTVLNPSSSKFSIDSVRGDSDSFTSEEEDDYDRDPDFRLSDLTGHFDRLYIKKNFKNVEKEEKFIGGKIHNMSRVGRAKENNGDNLDKIKNIMKQYVNNINN